MAGGADGAIGPADRASRDLEELRKRIEREIRRLLASLDTARGSDKLIGDKDALATAVKVRRQVVALLNERGYGAVVDVTTARALQAAEAVTKGNTLPAGAKEELQRIVSGQTAEVADVFGAAADEMRRAVNAGIASGGSLADLTELVAQRLEVATVRAQAAVDAAVMASGRRSLMMAAEATGIDYVYLYVGPTDGKNRDFCSALVGKAVTKARMARLVNEQGLPVRDFCGGYNCRHSWSPIPREEAIALGIEILE